MSLQPNWIGHYIDRTDSRATTADGTGVLCGQDGHRWSLKALIDQLPRSVHLQKEEAISIRDSCFDYCRREWKTDTCRCMDACKIPLHRCLKVFSRLALSTHGKPMTSVDLLRRRNLQNSLNLNDLKLDRPDRIDALV